MTFEHADLRGEEQAVARIDERVKGLIARAGQLESDVKELRDDITEIQKKNVRTDIANALVFGVAVLILMGFFGIVVAYFQGRPVGAPVSIRSSEGAK